MRNACLALINTKNTNSISGVSLILNSFLSFGYSCEEIRFIDEKRIISIGETVSALMKDYDSIRKASRGKFTSAQFVKLKELARNTIGASNEIFCFKKCK